MTEVLMETHTSQPSISEKYIDDHDDHSALMLAALEGNTAKVKALLSNGANVNTKDSAGRTALMFAVINMHYETVEVLLSHGADVNSRAVDGGTALILAASSGDPKIVQALLDQGADTHAKFTQTNMNAMMLAISHRYGQIIRLLGQAKS